MWAIGGGPTRWLMPLPGDIPIETDGIGAPCGRPIVNPQPSYPGVRANLHDESRGLGLRACAPSAGPRSSGARRALVGEIRNAVAPGQLLLQVGANPFTW